MPGADAAEAARIAERARRATESREFPVDGAGGSVSITVSIGLAEWRENWNSAELYRRADRALYRSKAAGRNASLRTRRKDPGSGSYLPSS
jgi:two-component system cell cycle response regulator